MRIDCSLLSNYFDGKWLNNKAPLGKFSGFSFDTRTLESNQCFLALSTGKNDGHKYLRVAQEKSACAAIVKEFDESLSIPQLKVKDVLSAFQNFALLHRKAFVKPLIAISGSVGKTSTKDILALLLGDRVCSSQGSFNNDLGVPFSLSKLSEESHDFAVLEAGISGFGEMESLGRMLSPDIAVILNVSSVHLENFSFLSKIAEEKSKLLQAVSKNKNFQLCHSKFLPLDLLNYDCFKEQASECTVIARIGEQIPNSVEEIVLYDAKRSKVGWSVTIFLNENKLGEFEIPFLLSEGMVFNFIVAISVAISLGVSAGFIQDRILQWRPSKNRGEWVVKNGKSYFLDCYNSNPLALISSVKAFQEYVDVPATYVIGHMAGLGKDSEIYHFESAKKLNFGPEDKIFLVGEDMSHFREGLLYAGNRSDQIQSFETAEFAKKALEHFKGKIFLKGSRYLKLESVVEL